MVGPLERPSRRSRASERPSRRSRPNRARILPKNVARRKKKTKTGLRTLRLRVVGGGRPRLSLGVPPRRLERLERSPAGPGIPGIPDPRGPRLAPRAPPSARRRPPPKDSSSGSAPTRSSSRRSRERRHARGSGSARSGPGSSPGFRRSSRSDGSASRSTQTRTRSARPADRPRGGSRSGSERSASASPSDRGGLPILRPKTGERLRLPPRGDPDPPHPHPHPPRAPPPPRPPQPPPPRSPLSRAHLPLVRLDADGAERKRPRRVDHVQAVHEPADDGSPRAALGLAAALVRMMMPARRLHARPGVVLVRLPGAPPTFLPPPAPGALHHAHEEEDDHHRAEGDARRDVALDAAGAGVARRRRVASRDQARARRVVRAVARVVLRMRRFVFMGSGASVDRFSVSDQR